MFKVDEEAHIPVRLLWQHGNYWRVSVNAAEISEFSIRQDQLVPISGDSKPMQIGVPFPVGSEVWLWAPSVGRVPVRMTIETISIWMDKRYPGRIKFSYIFEQKPDDRRHIPDDVKPFATCQEAVEHRDRMIARMRGL